MICTKLPIELIKDTLNIQEESRNATSYVHKKFKIQMLTCSMKNDFFCNGDSGTRLMVLGRDCSSGMGVYRWPRGWQSSAWMAETWVPTTDRGKKKAIRWHGDRNSTDGGDVGSGG